MGLQLKCDVQGCATTAPIPAHRHAAGRIGGDYNRPLPEGWSEVLRFEPAAPEAGLRRAGMLRGLRLPEREFYKRVRYLICPEHELPVFGDGCEDEGDLAGGMLMEMEPT